MTERDQARERWKRPVADFEAGDLTQRELASERGISETTAGLQVPDPRAAGQVLVTRNVPLVPPVPPSVMPLTVPLMVFPLRVPVKYRSWLVPQ